VGKKGTFLRLEMYLVDQKGKRKLALRKKNDPFVQAMLYAIYTHFTMVNQNWKDVSGTQRSYVHTSIVINPAAGNAYGIVVGTGANAVTVSDYTLQTLIAHGTGSGQLYYSANYWSAPTLSGSTYTTEGYRQIINLSGGDVTVNEVGIYGLNGGWYFLLARDTTGGITVPAEGILIVVYKVQTTI